METLILPDDSRWVVLERSEDYIYPKSGKRSIRYHCRCICGQERIVHKQHIKNGSSKSCGCLNVEISRTQQGGSVEEVREYQAWCGMRNRVNSCSIKNSTYAGVSICDEWLRSFPAFFSDLGDCPEGFELERIDSSLGYFPTNCCWASELRQAQNKGDYKNNTSGLKGVCWSKAHGKWRVYLYRNKKRYEGGLHKTLESAKAKRMQLEISYPMESINGNV